MHPFEKIIPILKSKKDKSKEKPIRPVDNIYCLTKKWISSISERTEAKNINDDNDKEHIEGEIFKSDKPIEIFKALDFTRQINMVDDRTNNREDYFSCFHPF